MNIGKARDAARKWVLENASQIPGFQGAWIAGSTNHLPDDAEFPATSDIDVMIVLGDGEALIKPGKFLFHGVLLEVSSLSRGEIATPEQVLGHYHLAGSLGSGAVLADSGGALTALRADVARAFPERRWVEQRVEQARQTVLSRVDAVSGQPGFAEQVMSWLFAAGGVPHILLVAGLRNPTVRKRYLAARDLLRDMGRQSLYPDMLALLDPLGMPPERVSHHLDVLAGAFDEAAALIKSPFFFAADLSTAGRAVAINGSRELADQGNHREAIFWIVATFARCQIVFHTDAPESAADAWDGAFAELLVDLGIRSVDDLDQRGREIRAFLPRVMREAEGIMDEVTTRNGLDSRRRNA